MTAPHLIDALEQLDDDSPQAQPDVEAPARRQPGTLWLVELEDGSSFTARTTNRDMIAWERTKARHKEWPTAEDAPVFATSFCMWNAARRAGATSLGFEQFLDSCLDFTKVDDEPADPTR